MSSFVDFFVKYLDTHYTSDMKVLAKWFQLNQDKVLVLQPVPSEMQFDVPLKSKYFYDPGDFGIFFFGNDARHNRLPIGKIRQVTNRSSFSNFLESEGTIQGKITNAKKINSTFVFALENTSISLNSIHMHSKFMPKSKRHLGMRISFLNMSHRIMFVDYLIFPFPMLDIRVFFERFISAIARRTNLQMGYRDFRLR
jgi:hypothetical protein